MNIRRSDLSTLGSFAKHGLIVNLAKQQLRLDIKDTAGSNFVKKPRSQVVYAIRDWLSILYKNQLQSKRQTQPTFNVPDIHERMKAT